MIDAIMKRRDFIQHTGLFAGGLLLSQYAAAFVPAEKKIRIAIIGCGDRGQGLLGMLNQLPDMFELAALCDTLPFRLADALKRAGKAAVTTTSDYRSILDDKNIDAVIISTPLNMHFPIAAAALDAGKHVYLEKAMTYNIEEVYKLVKLAAKHDKQTLQIGHQYRSTPLYYKVKEMIDKGYLGTLMQIDCRWDRNWNWRRPVPDPALERKINWRMYREYSGGLAAELLSHQIDFINWAFNTKPTEVLATGGIDFYKDGRETFDNVQVMMRYDQPGMIGNFGATCGNARDGYLFKLKGTRGTITLLMNDGIFYPEKDTRKELETVDGVAGATKITWNKDGGVPIAVDGGNKDGSFYALKSFYNCIITNTKPDSNVITGGTTAIAVHLANKAMYTNTIQRWQDSYNIG